MRNLNIDWKTIRQLNGSSNAGFEELCAQLVSAEIPSGLELIRTGTQDAGVEFYYILGDGTEWGWQAKYFDTLGNSQWSQIDASVRTALGKHPRLVRYFICIPLDLPDARIEHRMSAKDRWDAHVKTWRDLASSRHMNVEFVYWGKHELLQQLTHPKHIGRIRFWFDVHRFDKAWFTARLEEALNAAGPRYTPEINIDLPIAKELDTFGRTEQFFNRIKTQAQGIRRQLRNLEFVKTKLIEEIWSIETNSILLKVQTILSEISNIKLQPIGILPLKIIVDEIAATKIEIENLRKTIYDREQEYDTELSIKKDSTENSLIRVNPFREFNYWLYALLSELENVSEILDHSDSIASRSLMILKGAAGTGKTHLLCDIARQRISADLPTVLLMGQEFLSLETPWIQALQKLDLASISMEEFVGALETAAQVADCRALIIIDAINEGSGRLIWPSHLAAFLAYIERSPWIGVLLSIRISYEEIIIPEEIRNRAHVVTHVGFAEHAYDATRAFFKYYNIELPSTPLLAPEFSNPFFLKILCRGLNMKGERRLSRGIQGVTAIFDLFLTAINDRLASSLGFNPGKLLVQQALEKIAKTMTETGNHWLTIAKAEEVVNVLLPGREYERSLYRGMIVEGILIQDIISSKSVTNQEVVVIAYERLADYLITKFLLDKYLDPRDPASAFVASAPLAFLWDKSCNLTPGFLEAMCVQIPELSGQELITIAPNVLDNYGIGYAFRQSIIWRKITAFTDNTKVILNKLVQNEQDSDDTIDVLLTVAIIAGHPYNAIFLDQHLRKDIMPKRDAWWSIYLHHMWGNHGSVDRLIHWASSLSQEVQLEDETVDLCSITLSWMLSTSNRFLRDNATQSLVNLLTGRLNAVIRLIERFANIDDAYIAERIYAVAYGTVMRSYQSEQVGPLAQCVYNNVFASSSPPAHILLRDYARGIIERAMHLGAKIDVSVERIRPPYISRWPIIPDENEIKPFLPDYSHESHKNGDTQWAHNRIGNSVMGDDFARYIISTNWTSVRLEEPAWQSPDTRIAMLLKGFSEKEIIAWSNYQKANDIANRLPMKKVLVILQRDQQEKLSNKDISELGESDIQDPELTIAIQKRDKAFKELELILSYQHRQELQKLLEEKNDVNFRHPPRFDIRLIQRYILKRVFDLGWTTERFGEFDRFYIGLKGREASKAERIGKKYQWIAYHEIMALVADHFRYGERYSKETDEQVYEGPWQDHFRDIDPSCTLRGSREKSLRNDYTSAWWCPVNYSNWGDIDDAQGWLSRYDDIPKIEDMLCVSKPDDHSKWLNLQSFFLWQQPAPAEQDRYAVERRELWYILNGYLVRVQDKEKFIKWAKNVDFYGRWMPNPPEIYRMFLGEYGWSPAFHYFQQQYFQDYGDNGWSNPGRGCPMKVKPIACEYLREANGYDCSVEETFTLQMPAIELMTGLGLHWSGNGADYVDNKGKILLFNPSAYNDGPKALLLRQETFKEFLKHEGLTICWAVLGEKLIIDPGFNPTHESFRLSGAYVLEENGPVGFIKYIKDKR